MNNLKVIKNDFYKIKELGFVTCTRPNNKDGGIGNTYEDLLKIKENNLKIADYLGFELKSKRQFNSSYISLFSKSPSFPSKANSYLREKYGEVRDENFLGKKKLYASVFGNKYSNIYGKFRMKLEVDYKLSKLVLVIKNMDNLILDQVYWEFIDFKKACIKMKSLMLVLAETKVEEGFTKYHFNKAEIYHEFDFKSFLKNIEIGCIMFDIRIGVYNSGKNMGKTHDHGSGFRIKQNDFKNLYSSFEVL